MPDLPRIFDRALIARHLLRRAAGRDDFVTRLVLADLEERLGTVTRDFEQALIWQKIAEWFAQRNMKIR